MQSVFFSPSISFSSFLLRVHKSFSLLTCSPLLSLPYLPVSFCCCENLSTCWMSANWVNDWVKCRSEGNHKNGSIKRAFSQWIACSDIDELYVRCSTIVRFLVRNRYAISLYTRHYSRVLSCRKQRTRLLWTRYHRCNVKVKRKSVKRNKDSRGNWNVKRRCERNVSVFFWSLLK